MKITATDNGYVLENAAGETLALSNQDAVELAQNARLLLGPQARFVPLVTMNVEDAIVSIDVHHIRAILRLIGPDDIELAAYEMSGETAKKLSGALARKSEQIEAAQAKKTEH